MDTFGPSTYGDKVADVYDSLTFRVTQFTDACVEFLAGHAGRRRVLELGIGTGRIALPLAARGLKVHGIDASEKMVARLREKPGGADIPVEIGDFADVKVGGKFSLIYVAFNPFFALLTQDRQVRCMERVARHLSDDGVFVLEGFVPDLTRFDRGQRVGALELSTDDVRFEISTHDAARQHTRSVHVALSEQGVKLYPIEIRYAWPAELDLMARLAGMRLRARYGGWNREPFDASSQFHVSLYELVPKPSPPQPAKRRSSKRAARRRA
ncbi:MAG TPA: class I SAM-dependent methyltransferase [Candidatus Binataceae bacterium]|nr:class I SAM-dependent methyltransferase [Candidatus Binataceae bacterium]